MLGVEFEESVPAVTYKDKAGVRFFSNSSAISGNTNDIAIFCNKSPVFNKRVLIFGDSFFKGMLSIISSLFRDVVYLRSQYFHKEVATLMSPDIILTGSAERYLSKVNSDFSDADCHIMRLYGDSTYIPKANFIEAYKAQLSYGFYPEQYQYFYEKLNS